MRPSDRFSLVLGRFSDRFSPVLGVRETSIKLVPNRSYEILVDLNLCFSMSEIFGLKTVETVDK